MNENYKIVRPLGEGGFGKVYLVRDSRGREFALKSVSIFHPSKYTLNEFQVMKSLCHPRITRLLDFYPSSNAYNFVMEYADNGSLREYISKQKTSSRLRTEGLINFFMDVAHGVRYLHQRNIIHRDLKPENILIDGNFRLKLCDFGVSKVIADNFPNFQTSIGTFTYMSPEVYLHQPYNKSCDIWALGLILYELAFFRYMLSREEKTRILNFAAPYRCPVADWAARCYDVRLQGLLEKMVQRDPAYRSTADAICRDHLIAHFFWKREEETKAFMEQASQKRNALKSFNG